MQDAEYLKPRCRMQNTWNQDARCRMLETKMHDADYLKPRFKILSTKMQDAKYSKWNTWKRSQHDVIGVVGCRIIEINMQDIECLKTKMRNTWKQDAGYRILKTKIQNTWNKDAGNRILETKMQDAEYLKKDGKYLKPRCTMQNTWNLDAGFRILENKMQNTWDQKKP